MGWPQSEWPEFRLLLDPIDFLVPQVWSPGDPRWFNAEKGARVAQLCTDTVTLAVSRPGTVRLRVRWTPYWAVVAGDACVEPDGDWTRLRVRRAGEVRLATRFALGRGGARVHLELGDALGELLHVAAEALELIEDPGLEHLADPVGCVGEIAGEFLRGTAQ